METIVRINHSKEGKKLLDFIKSFDFVKVVGNAEDFVNVNELKQKVKEAEKSPSIAFQDAIKKSEKWKTRFK